MDILDHKIQKDRGHLHFWYRARKEFIADRLSSLCVSAEGGRRILDLGCGCGAELEELKAFGAVEALEVNPEAAALAELQGVKVMVEDAATADLGERSYDLICAFDFFEHVEDDKDVFAKAFRALKPGGRIFLTVPAYRWMFGEHDAAMGHWRRYSLQDLKGRLTGAGFSDIDVGHWNVLLFLPTVIWRLIKRLLPKGKLNGQDFFVPPKRLNRSLLAVMSFENEHHHIFKRFPGVSLVASGIKKI